MSKAHTYVALVPGGLRCPCKIGRAKHPPNRVNGLSLALAGWVMGDCEKRAHEHFADRSLGREWFDVDSDEALDVLMWLDEGLPL